jgi:imidazolonepropionase-like amidohydrolase
LKACWQPVSILRLTAALAALTATISACTPGNDSALEASATRGVLLGSTGTFAFVNVSVIPMDRERVIADQTVVVSDGKILTVGPSATVTVPSDATRLDGLGKFLMPGLAEMHAHIVGGRGANVEQLNRDIFLLYVANGITRIRGMLGAPNQLVLREQLRREEILGPTMYVGAPSINGRTAPDPATGERLVREYKAAGYDFLKIHPGPSRATYDAVARTAREVGITFAGHVPEAVGVRHALASRQSTIDHLDGYLSQSVADSLQPRILQGNVPLTFMLPNADESHFAALAQEAKAAGVWNVPTMFLWESFFSTEGPEVMRARPEMRFATREWLADWQAQKRQLIANNQEQGVTPALAQRYMMLRRKMLKALADAGAKLLMGTDSPQMFNVPGFSLQHEVELMVASGLTPYQVLESGTRNVATYAAEDLKLDGKFGTVAEGNRADLVLLDANPLTDIRNLARRSGVMVRGRWLPRAELDSALSALARRNGS